MSREKTIEFLEKLKRLIGEYGIEMSVGFQETSFGTFEDIVFFSGEKIIARIEGVSVSRIDDVISGKTWTSGEILP